MKVILLQTGKTTEKYVSAGIDEFASRIRKYTAFEIITLPELRGARSLPVAAQKASEARQILQYIGRDDFLIALDEFGIEFTTVQFARKLETLFTGSKKRIVFAVGGPWGFSDEVFTRADLKMSLSKMTFPHQLVRLLFLEQLYRALTVIKGDPYHHP